MNSKLMAGMPDYSNPKTRATMAEVGPFDYSSNNKYYNLAVHPNDKVEVAEKGPHLLDNNAVYLG